MGKITIIIQYSRTINSLTRALWLSHADIVQFYLFVSLYHPRNLSRTIPFHLFNQSPILSAIRIPNQHFLQSTSKSNPLAVHYLTTWYVDNDDNIYCQISLPWVQIDWYRDFRYWATRSISQFPLLPNLVNCPDRKYDLFYKLLLEQSVLYSARCIAMQLIIAPRRNTDFFIAL